MNYRSIDDLAKIIRENLSKVPVDVDLIVGIPRSGMLIASMLALYLNLKFCDVESYIANSPLKNGRTRNLRFSDLELPQDAKHVLLIDDSIDSGRSLEQTKQRIFTKQRKSIFTFAACFATPAASKKVDIFFEIVPQTRLFEWNVMHHPFLAEFCLDIDGVLCLDPTTAQNDDGKRYLDFLLNAPPIVLPSYPVGHIVTSRLEKYRKETEQWLNNHGVFYKELHMLNLPNAATRRKLGCHAAFKASVYRRLSETRLFVESDPSQSREIANTTGKYVLCFTTQELYAPPISYAFAEYNTKRLAKRIASKIYRETKSIFNHG